MKLFNASFIGALALGAVVALAPTPATAGGIDYLSNQSGQFIGDFSKNASTYGADTASYNPAGLPWLAGKLHISLSTQTVIKDFSITYKGTEYASTIPTPVVPSFFIVGKPIEDLAIYASFTVPAGGGSLKYDNGVPFLEALYLTVKPTGSDFNPAGGFFEGSSTFLAPTLGVSYRIADIVSLSVGARLAFATKTFNGSATYGNVKGILDAEKSAMGVAGIFGVHIRPIDELDIGLRFETETSLNFVTKSNLRFNNADGTPKNCTTPEETDCNSIDTEDNAVSSFRDGAEEKRNLPMILGVGVAGRPIPELTLAASFNYYFTQEADELDDVTGNRGYAKGYDDDYENGYDVAFSAAYHIIPEFQLKVGYNHTNTGGSKDTYNDFEYSLNSHSIGINGRVTIADQFDISLGVSTTLYNEGTNETMNEAWAAFAPLLGAGEVPGEQFNRWVLAIGFGLEWRPDI